MRFELSPLHTSPLIFPFLTDVRASLILSIIVLAGWAAWIVYFYVMYATEDKLRNFLVFTPRPYYN